jgi:hypothetical protein
MYIMLQPEVMNESNNGFMSTISLFMSTATKAQNITLNR